jgi:hypothetical protein
MSMYTCSLMYDALAITNFSILLTKIFAFIIRSKSFNAQIELGLYKGGILKKKLVGHLSYVSTRKSKRPLYIHQ